jgi:hypothetical protein
LRPTKAVAAAARSVDAAQIASTASGIETRTRESIGFTLIFSFTRKVCS